MSVVILPETSFIGPNQLFSLKPQCIWRWGRVVKGFSWTALSEFGTYRICEQRRFRRACASAQSLQNLRCSLIQAESRGTSRQKARSLTPLNGLACAVKVCHDGMLEDTNSLDGAQLFLIMI